MKLKKLIVRLLVICLICTQFLPAVQADSGNTAYFEYTTHGFIKKYNSSEMAEMLGKIERDGSNYSTTIENVAGLTGRNLIILTDDVSINRGSAVRGQFAISDERFNKLIVRLVNWTPSVDKNAIVIGIMFGSSFAQVMDPGFTIEAFMDGLDYVHTDPNADFDAIWEHNGFVYEMYVRHSGNQYFYDFIITLAANK